MWINPDKPDIFVQSNDGGANVTLDGGKTWSSQHNQPTAELYQVDISDEFPYRLYAGQQDNSTISVSEPAAQEYARRPYGTLGSARRLRDRPRRAETGRPGHRPTRIAKADLGCSIVAPVKSNIIM